MLHSSFLLFTTMSLIVKSALLLLVALWPQESFPAPLKEWAIEVRGGLDEAQLIADEFGLVLVGKIGNLPNMYQYVSSIASIRTMKKSLKYLHKEAKVGLVERQTRRVYEKKSYVAPSDPHWSKQWILNNFDQTDQKNINVEPVWIQGITGHNITVGVVDDGLDHSHPDLIDNYDSNSSYDYVNRDDDPSPQSSFFYNDVHGTKCAGVIAMSKDNGVCGVGVAYDAKVAGIRLITNRGVTDIQEAKALSHASDKIDIYSNSWGPSDGGFVVEGPRTLAKQALENGAKSGRNGQGSIFVWAAGNGGHHGDSCAADGYINSIYTIGVGAAGNDGLPAYYDEQCSAKMIVTFNHNTRPDYSSQVTTTSLKEKCDDEFTGTSASTPIVAGVVALTLQANPTLTWRDVQYLMVYSANTQSLTMPENAHLWSVNGAGIRISPQFGFGAVDAEAMVSRARYWTNVPDQVTQTFSLSEQSGFASNWSALDINWKVEKTDIVCLEHVVVRVTLDLVLANTPQFDYDDYYNTLEESLTHENVRRGDISIVVTSPSKTQSTILPYRDRDFINTQGYRQWPFLSVHFWGEDPVGTWSIRVTSRSAVTTVAVSDVQVTLYGVDEVPFSVSQIPSICSPSCHPSKGCSSLKCCDSCLAYRDAVTLECLPSCPNGTHSVHNYCIRTNESISYEYESTVVSSTQITPSTVYVASTSTSATTSSSSIRHGITSNSGHSFTVSSTPLQTGGTFLNIDKGSIASGSAWQCCSHFALLLCFLIALSIVLL